VFLDIGVCAALAAIWVLGLTRLDVFTPDDVRAFRRLAALRGYARRRSLLERSVSSWPATRRLQRELDLERLLAIASRPETPIGFLGRTAAYALVSFATVFALDDLVRTSSGSWPFAPWLALVVAALVTLACIARLRSQARDVRFGAARTLEDMMMPLAIITDSRGLQVDDAVRALAGCASDQSLDRIVKGRAWRRLLAEGRRSTAELYRDIGTAYGIPLFIELADAQAAVHVGVPEREVYARLAQAVYRQRLTHSRTRAARARALVTLPVAAMLIPLLLLVGAPALQAFTSGLGGG
jgi:hypothetical protein